ncbi:hypothetical protein O6H91_13G020600 [Diphasiastrum complanatum]|uniref:Uncharacterized protein n=1 Tax=Diphasiastrum complanatum TaxID=34168 RepID=A0ACC2BSR2_DIPCM|nr:hypothetical protein O6H91_13G020600 [Diphasiastrum complanatum]
MAGGDGGSREGVQWPEPIQRVQKLAASSLDALPEKYVRPASHRAPLNAPLANLPVIDLSGLADPRTHSSTVQQIGDACTEWGIFHAINHGIPLSLIHRVQQVSKELFDLPYEEKEVYANKPGLPVGYGSHLGASNSGTMDWSDYFFHQLRPSTSYDADSWPAKPAAYRETVAEYGKQVYSLMRMLLLAVAENLRVDFSSVEEAFGGKDGFRLGFRINYYPPCPQPALALGVSSHSDPGVLTALLQDEVGGLQVRKDGTWYSVGTTQDALVVNVADQLEFCPRTLLRPVG